MYEILIVKLLCIETVTLPTNIYVRGGYSYYYRLLDFVTITFLL